MSSNSEQVRAGIVEAQQYATTARAELHGSITMAEMSQTRVMSAAIEVGQLGLRLTGVQQMIGNHVIPQVTESQNGFEATANLVNSLRQGGDNADAESAVQAYGSTANKVGEMVSGARAIENRLAECIQTLKGLRETLDYINMGIAGQLVGESDHVNETFASERQGQEALEAWRATQ